MSKNISLIESFNLMKNAENIAITSHIHPDGDAVGSSLTLFQILQNLNKNVKIFINDKIPDWCSILPDCNAIERFPDKNYSADLILLLDARVGRDGEVCEKINAPILNIDHHITNEQKADYIFLNENASSTCEILFKFMQQNNLKIDEKIAMNLYAGIATDTGFFRFDNTSAEILEIAADLIRKGAKPSLIADSVATKTFHEIELMSKAMQTIKLFKDGKIIGIFLDENFSDLELTDGLIDMIRFTKDVDIAFLIKYDRKNVYRLRMRSRRTDISSLLKKIGGGGHIHAAGATLKGENVVEKFISFLETSDI